MSSKVDMKKHGNKTIQVLHDEFLQTNDMVALKPIKSSDLTRQQIRDALYAVHAVKEKRNDSLKGRTCADEKKSMLHQTRNHLPNVHNSS